MYFSDLSFQKEKQEEYIEVTCYDQLIYLSKNKDSINYKDKSTSDLLKFLCTEENNLKTGDIWDTTFCLSGRRQHILS